MQNITPKKQGFIKRIIIDNHEFVITFCIGIIFLGFLFCITAILYRILTVTGKVDDSLMDFFKEFDDLVKMILTYIFTRWQMGKTAEKDSDENTTETKHQ